MKLIPRRTRDPIFWGASLFGSVLLIAYLIPMLLWVSEVFESRLISRGAAEWAFLLPFWKTTVLYSALAASIAVLFAYPVALISKLSGSRSQIVLAMLVSIPLMTGFLARNYSWIGLFSGITISGVGRLESQFLKRQLYQPHTVYFVLGVVFCPLAFFTITQGFRNITREQVDACRTLGVPDWRIPFALMIPASMRSALLSFAIILAMSSGYFITPKVLSGGKIDFVSNIILVYVERGDFREASHIAIKFLAVTLVIIAGIGLLSLRRRMMSMGR